MVDRDLHSFASITRSMTDILLASYAARKGFDIQPSDNQIVARGPAVVALGMWRRSTNFIKKCAIVIEAARAAHDVELMGSTHLADLSSDTKAILAVKVATFSDAAQVVAAEVPLNSLTCIPGARSTGHLRARVALFESFLTSLPPSQAPIFSRISVFLCADTQDTLHLLNRMTPHCLDITFFSHDYMPSLPMETTTLLSPIKLPALKSMSLELETITASQWDTVLRHVSGSSLSAVSFTGCASVSTVAQFLRRHPHISRLRYAATQGHSKSFARQIHRPLHLPHLRSLSGSLCRVIPLLESIFPSPSLIHLELDTVRNISYRAWVERVTHCVYKSKGTLILRIGYRATVSSSGCSRVKQFRLRPSLVYGRVILLSLTLINLCDEEVTVSTIWLSRARVHANLLEDVLQALDVTAGYKKNHTHKIL